MKDFFELDFFELDFFEQDFFEQELAGGLLLAQVQLKSKF